MEQYTERERVIVRGGRGEGKHKINKHVRKALREENDERRFHVVVD